jgi:hypothetical protein
MSRNSNHIFVLNQGARDNEFYINENYFLDKNNKLWVDHE